MVRQGSLFSFLFFGPTIDSFFCITICVFDVVISHNLKILKILSKERCIMKIETAFSPGGQVPREFTCDGEGRLFDLKVSEIPSNTKCLALIIDDPDAPGGIFTHFIAWNIPIIGTVSGCENLVVTSRIGKNSTGSMGYEPPCPPTGEHRYFIKSYALDDLLDLKPGASREELEISMSEHVIKRAEIFGTYTRVT